MHNSFFSQKISNFSLWFLLATMFAFLAGCGGGGGGGTTGGTTGTTPTTTQTITGTAATGAALAGATITVKDSLGNTASTTTANNGTFTLSVTGMTPPFILQASLPGTLGVYNLYSGLPTLNMTTTSTTNVNITPITTLVMYELKGSDPGNLYGNFKTAYTALTDATLIAAQTNVRTRLAAKLTTAGVPTGFNMMFDTFIVGSAYDVALDSLGKITSYTPTIKLTTVGNVVTIYTPAVPPVSLVALSTGGASIVADGVSTVTVRAKVTDTNGAVMSGITVNFTTSAGTLSPTTAVTDSLGFATTSLQSSTITGSATIGANTAGVIANTATVNFIPGPIAAIGMNLQPSTILPGGTTALTVVAVDTNTNPVAAGQTINFSSDSTTGGLFSANSAITDANGRVTAITYTAGSAVGTEVLKAKTSNGTFKTANLTLASGIAVVGSISVAPTTASIKSGGATTNLNATLLSSTGSPIANATVTFTLAGAGAGVGLGAGTLSSATATTNNSGVATVVLTSGPNVQTASISASSNGYTANTSVVYTAGVASAIGLNAAPNAAIPKGSSTITAAVVDLNGNPVANEPITFSFAQKGSGTPSLSATSAATDVNGLVRVTYTAGANAGTDIVTAITSNSVKPCDGAAPPVTPVACVSNAHITVANSAAVVGSIVASSSKASIPVTTGSTQIIATVTDTAGAPLAGQTVTFAASAGSFATATATTDVNGIATNPLVAGSSVMTSTVRASTGGFTSNNVSVAFTAGAANTITVSAAPAAIGIGGTSTLTAYVVDAHGNPVVGEPVSFAITTKASGPNPTLGSASALTNANGLAVVSYTAGATTAGADVITATTSIPTVNSTVTVTSAAGTTAVNNVALTTGAASIAAGGSTTFVRAVVTDIHGAPAAGVTVTLSTSLGTLSAGPFVTDGTGTVQATLTSSKALGTANIVANANGFVSTANVAFTAGSPNAITLLGTTSLASGATATLTAVLVDANNNPVPNQTVTFAFTANATGGKLASVTAQTSVNGIATVVYTAGATAGTDTVTATYGGTVGTTSTAVSLTVVATTAATLSIATSASSLKSDNLSSATITVTALNSSNAVVPGISISFSSSGGALSAGPWTTNASGQATVTVTSGAADRSNRTITITATSPGASSVSIPIQITGSSVTLTPQATVLVSGASPTSTTLTVTATDALNAAVFNTAVSLAVSGSGSVTLSPTSGVTNNQGKLAVTVTGLTSGTATVTATALGATGTQNFTISASGSEFKISSPVSNPVALVTNTGSLPFVVQAGSAVISDIRLSTTIGTWSECPTGTVVPTPTSVCDVPVATPTATLKSTLAGVASVQVDGCSNAGCTTVLGVPNVVVVSDSRKVAMASTTAASISVQSSVNILQPSSGGTINSANITATVRDAGGQPVGNNPVVFSLMNPTGGGETISPTVVLSSDGIASVDPIGQAKAVFTSGSTPTAAGGVTILGMVVGGNNICAASITGSINATTLTVTSVTSGVLATGQTITGGTIAGSTIITGQLTGIPGGVGTYSVNTSQVVASTPITTNGTAICGTTAINIGGTAASIVIGQPTTISSVPTDTTNTTYLTTMNLLVSDSNGNPVSGAVVSLNVWPIYFRTGVYRFDSTLTPPCYTSTYAEFPNEDTNKNLILDPGEALTDSVAQSAVQVTGVGAGTPGAWPTPYIAQSTQLIPPAAAAGSVPATVTTDSNGLANFNLIFLKQYSSWIVVRITAKTLVLGTETTSSLDFVLDKSVADMSGSNCVLPNSPWNTQ